MAGGLHLNLLVVWPTEPWADPGVVDYSSSFYTQTEELSASGLAGSLRLESLHQPRPRDKQLAHVPLPSHLADGQFLVPLEPRAVFPLTSVGQGCGLRKPSVASPKVTREV